MKLRWPRLRARRATEPAPATGPEPPPQPPLEESTWPDRGRERPAGPGTSALSSSDYAVLLEALGGFSRFAIDARDQSATGVGLRLDLAGGLTANALALIELEQAAGVNSLKALSLFAAGDLLVFSEGRLAIEPRAWHLIDQIVGPERRFAGLNELADALVRSQTDPWLLYTRLVEEFKAHGYELAGFVTGLDEDPATDLNLMLLHAPYWGTVPDEMFRGFGVLANELRPPGGIGRKLTAYPDGRPLPDADFDRIARLEFEQLDDEEVVYSRRLRRCVRRRTRFRIVRRVDHTVVSTPGGWRVFNSRGETPPAVDTRTLLRQVPTMIETGSVMVICNELHLPSPPRSTSQGDDELGPLRTMPFPFHHALSFSSDIDWSTPAQVDRAHERLAGELGLPVAGSFYLTRTGEPWVAAVPDDQRPKEQDRAPSRVADWFSRGAMDTLHAWVNNIFSVAFTEAGGGVWTGPPSVQLASGGGFLVTATVDLTDVQVMIETPGLNGGHTLDPVLAADRGANDRHAAYFPVEQSASLAIDGEVRLRVLGLADGAKVLAVEFNTLDPARMSASVSLALADHVAPLVFTTHGGGTEAIQRLGNLHAPGSARWGPDDVAHDADQPHSPYGLLREMRRLGVRMFSPIGGALTPRLTPVDRLVEADVFRDGSSALQFRRFCSRRPQSLGFPETWAYGKNVANPAALGFQVSEVLERFHWVPPGHAAVLYNHFGHNVGNQLCDRLAWSEETHGIFEEVAAFYHPDGAGASSAYRLWVSSTASLLLFAAVRDRLQANLTVESDRAIIRSWHDEALGVDVPDLERFGTRLLHGQTIYVPSSAETVLEIDGRRCTSFTRNGPDQTGRPSITVVDDTAPRIVLVDGNTRSCSVENCRVRAEGWSFAITPDAEECRVIWQVFPVALEAACHWTFQLEGTPPGGFGLALQDERGVWYEAGGGTVASADSTISWRILAPTAGRHVLGFADRAGHPEGPPSPRLQAVRLRLVEVRPGHTVTLSRLALLRPSPNLLDPDMPRILAGVARSDVDIDWSSWAVVCRWPDGEIEVPLLNDGRFVVRDLPPAAMVNCLLTDGRNLLCSARGRVAVMTTDQFGWDFHIPPDPGVGHRP